VKDARKQARSQAYFTVASLIGAWVSSSAPAAVTSSGGTSDATVKYAWLLACFLASFTCFVQSAGCYVHTSFQISALGSDAPASHLQHAVHRGGGFWASGFRPLYLATALLVWVVFIRAGGHARLHRADRCRALPAGQQLRAAAPPPAHAGRQGVVPDDGETDHHRKLMN
jgi:hypothetical protein